MQKIIEVNNVSIKFKMTKEQIFSLKEYFIKFIKRQLEFEEFNALTDISFSVNKGDILGIIGYFVYEYLNSEKNNQNLYNNEFVEQNEYSNIDTSNNQGENTGILTPILNEIKDSRTLKNIINSRGERNE